MSQTDYPLSMSQGIAGMLSDASLSQKDSRRNGFGDEVPFGVCAILGSDDDSFTLPSASGDKTKVLGVTLHTHARETIDGAGVAIADGARASLLARGRCIVAVEQAVTVADPVYVRYAAQTFTQLGAFRKDPHGVSEVHTITPTVADLTAYQLTVTIDGTDYVFDYTSDGSATATEICNGLRAAMALDATFSALITASGTTTVILTRVATGMPFTSASTGTGTLTSVTGTPAAPTAFHLKGARWTRNSVSGLAELEIDALATRLS